MGTRKWVPISVLTNFEIALLQHFMGQLALTSIFSFITDHIKEPTHPINVHPVKRFKRKIAIYCFLCLAIAIIEGSYDCSIGKRL